MLSLTRWCLAHRLQVFVVWVVVAVATSIAAQAVGRRYATNFSLPGTESQQVVDLLQREFASQSGDVDELVFHVSHGTVMAPAVKAAITSAVARVQTFPHVVDVISPYGSGGAVEISKDGRTAFATINYDKRSNLLPNATGKPLLELVKSVHIPGLELAVGGQVVENAEGFNIGPATTVGVIAASPRPPLKSRGGRVLRWAEGLAKDGARGATQILHWVCCEPDP